MKATIKVTPNLSIDVEADSAKAVFEGISDAQATFEDSECGACKGKDIKYVVREVEDNKFYEIHCMNYKCRAKICYGHSKDGKKMYPKRYEVDGKGKAKKDKDGKSIYLPNNGWVKYVAEETK